MSLQSETQRRHLGGESIVVICFVVFTALYIYQSFGLQRTMMSDLVGPSLFPQLVAGLAFFLAAIYFFQVWVLKGEQAIPDDTRGPLGELSSLLPVIPIVGYVLILEPIGFLFATALYVFVAMLAFRQSLMKSAAYALTLSIGFFVLFYYLLLTTIPMGWYVQTDRLLPFLVQWRRAMGG